MTPDEARRLAPSLKWFHSIDLSGGVVTKGNKSKERLEQELESLRLPNLQNKTVLDVGAWDGYFSFAAELAGAKRVVANDRPNKAWGGWGDKRAFLCARDALQSNVHDLEIDAARIDVANAGGSFDIVLCLGVLYHMQDPFSLIRRLSGLTKELLVLETHVARINERWPVMEFYRGDEMSNTASNWWGPNPACVMAMMKVSGFKAVRPVAVNEGLDGLYEGSLYECRMVFHGWKNRTTHLP